MILLAQLVAVHEDGTRQAHDLNRLRTRLWDAIRDLRQGRGAEPVMAALLTDPITRVLAEGLKELTMPTTLPEADLNQFHVPTLAEDTPSGYLKCGECGQVMDIFQWSSTRCRGESRR